MNLYHKGIELLGDLYDNHKRDLKNWESLKRVFKPIIVDIIILDKMYNIIPNKHFLSYFYEDHKPSLRNGGAIKERGSRNISPMMGTIMFKDKDRSKLSKLWRIKSKEKKWLYQLKSI